MAGDSDEVLDVILKENTLEKIKVMVKNLPLTIEISKNVVWLLINILRDTVYKGDFIIFFEIVEIIMENNCYEEDLFESLMLVLDKIVKKNPNVSVFEQRIDEIEGLFVKIIFYLNQEYEKMKDNVISYFLNFFGIFLLSSDETIEVIIFFLYYFLSFYKN